jgi:hypothetical protein
MASIDASQSANEPAVTVGIDRDRWYPVYSIVSADTTHATRCEIPASLKLRAEMALEDFQKVQAEIEQHLPCEPEVAE